MISFGIVILISDKHSKKAFQPIRFTESGIIMLDNDEHPAKQLSLISATLFEILMF